MSKGKVKLYGWRWVNVAMAAFSSWAGTSTVVTCFQFPASIVEEFKIGSVEFGLFMAAYLIAMMIFGVFAGRIVDKVGSKPSIVVGLIINAISQFGFAVSPNYWTAWIFRFIVGIGVAMWFTATPRILGAWAGPGELGLHQGIYFGFQFCGTASAGLLAPIYFSAFGHSWRNAIHIFGIWAVVAAVLVAALMRERPPTATDGGEKVLPSAYSSSATYLYSLFFGGVTAGMYVNLTYGPAYAYSIGLTEAEASTIAGAFGWFAFPAAILGGVIADRIRRNYPVMIAGSVLCCLPWLIPTVGPTLNFPLIILAYGLTGWGPLFAGTPGVSSLIMSGGKHYRADHVGSAMGVLNTIGFGMSLVFTQVAAFLIMIGWFETFLWATVGGIISLITAIASIKWERAFRAP